MTDHQVSLAIMIEIGYTDSPWSLNRRHQHDRRWPRRCPQDYRDCVGVWDNQVGAAVAIKVARGNYSRTRTCGFNINSCIEVRCGALCVQLCGFGEQNGHAQEQAHQPGSSGKHSHWPLLANQRANVTTSPTMRTIKAWMWNLGSALRTHPTGGSISTDLGQGLQMFPRFHGFGTVGITLEDFAPGGAV